MKLEFFRKHTAELATIHRVDLVQSSFGLASDLTRSAAAAVGDVDGDGDTDAVLFLVQDPGGSGTFYYVAAAYKIDGGYLGGTAVLIGDRITPHRLDVVRGVVVVDYLERAPGEPMAAEPTLARTRYLML